LTTNAIFAEVTAEILRVKNGLQVAACEP
jgi:hypothetical protein